MAENHHYVPKVLLKRFHTKNGKNNIFRYNIKNNTYSSNGQAGHKVEKVASEIDYNTVTDDNGNIESFEKQFDKIDPELGILYSNHYKKFANNTLKYTDFSDKDLISLIEIIAFLHERTEMKRVISEGKIYVLNECFQSTLGMVQCEKNDIKNLARRMVRDSLVDEVDHNRKILKKMKAQLLKANEEISFFISDNPVCSVDFMDTSFQMLGTNNIEVILPLSPKYAIFYTNNYEHEYIKRPVSCWNKVNGITVEDGVCYLNDYHVDRLNNLQAKNTFNDIFLSFYDVEYMSKFNYEHKALSDGIKQEIYENVISFFEGENQFDLALLLRKKRVDECFSNSRNETRRLLGLDTIL